METITRANAIKQAIENCINLKSNNKKCHVKFITTAGTVRCLINKQANEFEQLTQSIFTNYAEQGGELSDHFYVNTPYNNALKFDNAIFIYPNGHEENMTPMYIFVDHIIGVTIEEEV